MTTVESDTKTETGRTPSMLASLLVFGVMIGLIVLCARASSGPQASA